MPRRVVTLITVACSFVQNYPLDMTEGCAQKSLLRSSMVHKKRRIDAKITALWYSFAYYHAVLVYRSDA